MANMTVTLNDVELTVEYTYNRAYRGARDSFMGRAGAGAQLEPDEPASIDIEEVKIDSQEVSELLSTKQMEEIEELVMKQLNDSYDDYDGE